MALRWVGPAILAAGDRIVGISSGAPARAAEVAAALGGPTVHESVQALLGSREVDAVYISSLNHLHAAQAIAAAAAGKHVLCEKPLATSVADAQRMIDAAEAAGTLLATNHHLRNASAHRAIRRLVAEGALGRVVAARVHHATYLPREWHGWRLTSAAAGAGVALDLTVHSADLLRYLLADEVADVTAVSGHQGLATHGIEDALMTAMRFRDGALASVHDAFTVPNASTSVELLGDRAAVVAPDGMSGRRASRVLLRRGGAVEPVDVGRHDDPYEVGVRRFRGALRGEGTPTATGHDGLEALRIALAARSAALGRGFPALGLAAP
jgi:1,5-anhydro-D-fructose reductase (1,5-anhydro-D-mannitol-forming)